jgi:hypothetical protein
MIIYGGLVLLFQPFFKIALGREIWNIVDLVVGIGLLISIFMKTKESPRQKQAHLQFAQANAQAKNCKKACFANADKIVIKKFPNASKNMKIH